MITEIAICYDYFPTDTLEAILRNDLWKGDASVLSTDAILHISKILCKRRPITDQEYEKRKNKFWQQLQAKYFELDEDTE